MQRIFTMVFLSGLMMVQTACAIQMQDELECVLPNGDKFELVSKYDYELLSFILKHIGDVAQRLNQQPFMVYYKPKDGKLLKPPVSQLSRGGSEQLSTENGRIETCATIAFMRNTYTAAYTVRLPGSIEFSAVDPPSGGFRANIGKIAQNYEFSLYPRLGYFGIDQNTLIYEAAMHDKFDPQRLPTRTSDIPIIIAAVYRITSANYGKTWSEPVVTTDSKLFVIGKSLLDQPGIAKPGKYKIGPGR